jgi:predicted ester cyclase
METLTQAPRDELAEALRDGYHLDARVNVTHPVNELHGIDATLAELWSPLRDALPDAERREDIVLGGRYADADWISCMGHYVGTFLGAWLGIPPTNGVIAVRYAEAHRLSGDKIAESYIFIDWLDLLHQVGYFPLAPSLGREMRWLPPMTHDGVVLSPQDDGTSRATIERVLAMHAALGNYDGRPPSRDVLDVMHMADHWHPNMMWYGPAGIGTTRGLAGFENDHQIPFLVAFPDRGGSDLGHFIQVGDGHYAVTGGWGYLQATHTGDFLGMPPTGKRIRMRVMDFYRCTDETIVENWVPIDVPHILLQMGLDIFGRMRHWFHLHGRRVVSD